MCSKEGVLVMIKVASSGSVGVYEEISEEDQSGEN